MLHKLKTSYQLSIGLVALTLCLVVFQNCSKTNLNPDAEVNAQGLTQVTVTDKDAENFITVLKNAGVQADTSNPNLPVYEVDSLACGSYYTSRSVVDCVAAVGEKEVKTRLAGTEKVRNYLMGIGAKGCTNCPEVAESYKVSQVVCKQNPKFSLQTTCTMFK